LAEYRDATSALRARVEALEAELRELEPELVLRRDRWRALNLEQTSLEAALGRAPERGTEPRHIERILAVVLLAPAAGGLGVIVTLVFAALVGSIFLGDAALAVGAVLSIFGGLYTGYRTAREMWRDGRKQ
jgi:hypothetical protein